MDYRVAHPSYLHEFAVSGPVWRGLRSFSTLRTRPSTEGRIDANFAKRASDPESSRILAQANRDWLQPMLPSPMLWYSMTHGTDVCDLDVLNDRQTMPDVDGLVTTRTNQVLTMLTADCLPVLLVDTEKQVLALAHAGWRGLGNGILESTVRVMRTKGAQHIRAWIGPAIHQQAFEVGLDVFEFFTQQDPNTSRFFTQKTWLQNKWLLDIIGLATYRLLRVGVEEVIDSGLCSHAQSDQFFSYRKNHEKGRILTVAWLDES